MGGETKKKAVAVINKKCIIISGIIEEDTKVVVMVAKVFMLVMAMEDYLISTTKTVVSGKISNMSVDHSEEERTGSLIRATQVIPNNYPTLTTERCAVLPDLLNHENAP